MRKLFQLLTLTLSVLLTLTSVLSLNVSAASANGLSSSANNAYMSALGEVNANNLVITEIYAGSTSEQSYQFIEVLNTSETTVDLAEYYLYRNLRGNASCSNQSAMLHLLGQGDALCSITKVKLASTSQTLASGEVAVLYLQRDTTVDADAFRSHFGMDNGVAVVTVNVSAYPVSDLYSNETVNSNNAFLPVHYVDCILSLVQKDAMLYIRGSRVKFCEKDGDTFNPSSDHDDLTCLRYVDERYSAADSNAVFFTEGGENVATSHHYYGWANMNAYEATGENLYVGAYSNFLTGKLTARGKYDLESESGVAKYVDESSEGKPYSVFFSSGSLNTPNPGKLCDGQFGENAIRVIGHQLRGDDIRVVATFEADALSGDAVGFELVANHANGTTKTLSQNCYTVYAKLSGTAEVNKEQISLDETYFEKTGSSHEYFAALTVTDVDSDVLSFTVRPYVLNGTHKTYGDEATLSLVQNLSKKEQIVNGFNMASRITPTMHEIAGLQPTGEFAGIKAVWFEGMEQNGNKTKVFAYVGMPAGASASTPVPAVVLMHGGGGHAFLTWVKQWNDAGYAAIAIDHMGAFPTSVNAGIDEGSGYGTWIQGLPASLQEEGYTAAPARDNMANSTGDVDDMWMYHAVGQAILGGNILRADARVDAEKVGIVGISWGGVVTSITIGYESRFAFAVPIYGSGYLDEAKTYMKDNFSSADTKELWLAQDRFENVDMPVLWLCWNDDKHFSINSNSKSYLDTVKNNTATRIAMISNMGHSHQKGWVRAESIAFADSVVKSGAKMTGFASQPSETEYEVNLTLNVDSSATKVTAKVYYITSKMTFSNHTKYNETGTFMDQIWKTADLTVNGTQVTGTIPVEARGYYIEITTTIDGKDYVTSSVFVEPTWEIPEPDAVPSVEVNSTESPDIGEGDTVKFEMFQ